VADDPQPGPDPDDGESVPNRPDDSDSNPFGAFNPFSIPGLGGAGGFDLNSIMRMLASDGPVNWDVAAQTAQWVAAGEPTPGRTPAPDRAVDAATETELLSLTDLAVTHVVGATGLSGTYETRRAVIGRQAWAAHELDALKPVLEALAATLERALLDDEDESDGEIPADPFGVGGPNPFGMIGGDPFGGMMKMLGPALLGVQAGSMVGFLAQQALGRYDLPLPVSDEPSLTFVAENIDHFIEAWSLPPTDTRLYVAMHEVTHAAVRSVPWVRERLVRLAEEYVRAYSIDPNAIESQFGNLDPSDPSTFAAANANPMALLGAIRSPGQTEILERLRCNAAVIEGYADQILEHAGRPLIPTFGRIHEALARHRLERGEAGRFIEGLLGLDMQREHYERGSAFAAGVVEREGLPGLNRLWESEAMMPTTAELDAPGLWLARIEFMDD